MLYSGTDPESYITEYSLVYEEKTKWYTILVHHGYACYECCRAGEGTP